MCGGHKSAIFLGPNTQISLFFSHKILPLSYTGLLNSEQPDLDFIDNLQGIWLEETHTTLVTPRYQGKLWKQILGFRLQWILLLFYVNSIVFRFWNFHSHSTSSSIPQIISQTHIREKTDGGILDCSVSLGWISALSTTPS